MGIPVRCVCGKKYRVKSEFQGKTLKCPACMQLVKVPADEGTPVLTAGIPDSRPDQRAQATPVFEVPQVNRKCPACDAYFDSTLKRCPHCRKQRAGKQREHDYPPIAVGELKRFEDAANYRRMMKTLNLQGFGSIAWGAMAFVMGLIAMQEHPVNLALSAIGGFLVVSGMYVVQSPSAQGLILDGVGLMALGIWNVVVWAAYSGSIFSCGIGGLQFFTGVYALSEFPRFARLCRTPPGELICDRVDNLTAEIERASPKDHDDMVEFTTAGFWGEKKWKGRFFDSYAVFVGQNPTFRHFSVEVIYAAKDDVHVELLDQGWRGSAIQFHIAGRKMRGPEYQDCLLAFRDWQRKKR